MRVLVLGGTRFIGPMVVNRLVEAGHEVMAFHRGQSDVVLPPSVRHLYGERKNLGTFPEAFRDFSLTSRWICSLAPKRTAMNSSSCSTV